MSTFDRLGLSDSTLKLLSEIGFLRPTEIQAKAIPRLLQEQRDFIGLAQTGTGKTAAFGLPLIDLVDSAEKFTQALVLAPTRELGQQIAEQLNLFSRYDKRLNVLAVYGGAPIQNQLRALKKPQHIIIATPGRLIDLINRRAVDLRKLQYLVLDEADEMLNMGFKPDIDQILSFTPDYKLVWLFSATMSPDINSIVKTYMEDPAEVRLSKKNQTNQNITHQYTIVKQSDKPEALMRFLDANPKIRGVAFCRTRRDTQELADLLHGRGYKSDALHGDMNQRQRDRVMKQFKNQDINVLVATDVAARGIDVDDLSHIFHLALPDDVAYYTHRSGRTARAGKKGISLVLAHSREKGKVNRISNELKIKFTEVAVPQTHDIVESRVEKWCLDILDTRTKGSLDPLLLEKAILLFGNLSKEELIAKILAKELSGINLGDSKDLNDRRGPKDQNKKKYRKDKAPFDKFRKGKGKGRSGRRGKGRR
ncbi:MAG: DEAD/DEAH box helicase [Bacteroidota bacterium]